jgi:hypothetical protein
MMAQFYLEELIHFKVQEWKSYWLEVFLTLGTGTQIISFRAWVFNPRPARLYHAVRGHICRFYMYY